MTTISLVESLADWLVFCRTALRTKEDMDISLLDERTSLPLVAVDETSEYAQSAAWVTTPIKYGGLWGFWQTRREISLEELLQRAKARTASGRRANRRAAREGLKKLDEFEVSQKQELEAARASAATSSRASRVGGRLSARLSRRSAAEDDPAQAEVERLQANLSLAKIARQKLRALATVGYLAAHRDSLYELRYIDPRADSRSKKLFEESAGRLGWIRQKLTCGWICYLTCYVPLKLNFKCACFCCWMAWHMCSQPKPPKRNSQEKRLLARMKTEQRRRDKNVKLWIGHVNQSIAQLNRLLPVIQKRLISSIGYKLDLRSCIGLIKTDLAEMCAMQQGGEEALRQVKKGAAMDAGKSALKELMKNIKPKIKLETDFSLLREGKSPITDFEINFQVAGMGSLVGDDNDDDDDDGEEEEGMAGGGLWELGSSKAYSAMARKLLLAQLKTQVARVATKLGLDAQARAWELVPCDCLPVQLRAAAASDANRLL